MFNGIDFTGCGQQILLFTLLWQVKSVISITLLRQKILHQRSVEFNACGDDLIIKIKFRMMQRNMLAPFALPEPDIRAFSGL